MILSLISLKGFFLAAIIGALLPGIFALVWQFSSWRTVIPLLLALGLIGACAGFAGGMSRAPVVGDIIPAFLGLLGVVAVYLFGVNRSQGLIVPFGAASLALSLAVGYELGAQRRLAPEDHRDIRAICAKAYTNDKLLSDAAAFEKFEEALGHWCKQSMAWHLSKPSS